MNVVGWFIGGEAQIGSIVFPAPREKPGFLAVLDGNDGSIRRVNLVGQDRSIIDSPRLSFSPTGLRLLSVSLLGQGRFGDAAFGEPFLPPFIEGPTVNAVYASLVR